MCYLAGGQIRNMSVSVSITVLYTAGTAFLNMRDSLRGVGTHGFIVGLFIRL